MSKKVALIVDDSQDWRTTLEELFLENNYEVMTAGDRASANLLLSTHRFDIAVVDVNLTDEIHNIDGLLINKELKRKSPSTRVVLISARDLTAPELEKIKPSIFVKKSNVWVKLNSMLMDLA
jgi:DNA-binding response OmpR family regulator